MAGYLGAIPVPQATQHRESFTATSGQTTFNTAGYTVGFLDVYLNGSHLSPADFTATNGSDVVLASGASANDVCDIISYTAFEVNAQTFTGTTNLDVVDVDGAVNFAADVTFADGADIITASAGTSNFRAGVNAGNSIESGGNYNVAVGDEAGTAITTGDSNIAIGFSALLSNATADHNLAIGFKAGEFITTGEGNTHTGYLAGRGITGAKSTGDYNTTYGRSAGTALQGAATLNTFVGALTGDSVTTGS